MVDVGISGTEYLNDPLVERIVESFSHTQREPGIATLHLALHTPLLGLFAEGFLLGIILQLEQGSLLQECLYRCCLLHIVCKGMAKFRDCPYPDN